MEEEREALKLVESDHVELFEDFLKELSRWPDTGTEPRSGNQDIRYYLDLEEQRLKERGLSMKLDFKAFSQVDSSSKVAKLNPVLNILEFSRYQQSMNTQRVEKSMEYFRKGKSRYRSRKDVVAYLTILEPKEENAGIGEETYTCPNCGAISPIHVLEEEGCPYCRTRYLITDLFPKVTNYYFLETVPPPEKLEKGRKGFILGGIGIMYLIGLITLCFSWEGPESIIYLIFLLLGGGLMGAFEGYFVYSIVLAAKLLSGAGKSMPVVIGSAGSRSSITKKVSAFDPAFSYEYFEGKALSLARIVLFSPDPAVCIQYSDNTIRSCFRNIININYRGGMNLISIGQKGTMLEVRLRLYLTNIYDINGKIRERDEVINLTLHHNAEFRVVPNFSIKKVECSSCGGSFDATRYQKCPYCDTPYDVCRDDWIVKYIWK